MTIDLKQLHALIDFDSFLWRVGAVTNDEPVENALYTLKQIIEGFKEQFGSIQLYLTGRDNFRTRIATIQEYKGNRQQEKPKWYSEMKDYAISSYGASVSVDREADDDVGIAQWAAKDRSTCIVSLDKDMNCIPGHHWHPIKQTYYYVTLAEANKNFWTQVLTGDSTDNVRGIPKVGPKTAEKLLEGKESWNDLAEAARKAYADKGIEHELAENASLVWILREDGIGYDGRPIREAEVCLQES